MHLQFPRLSLRLPRPFSGSGLSLFPERAASPVRRIVLLSVWGVLVFSVCLGSRLASDQFADILRKGLPPETGLRLATTKVAPLSFPPGATVEALSLLRADNRPLVNLTQATLRMSLWSLLTGRLGINVSGAINDGHIDATVATGFLFDASRVKTDASLKSLPLHDVPAATVWDGALKGIIDGSIYVNTALAKPLAGDMDIDVTATGLDIKNIVPLLSPKRLPALEVHLKAEAAGQTLAVDRFQVEGKDIMIFGDGKAALNPEAPAQSKLDFGARIKIPATMVIAPLIRSEDYKRLQRGKELNVTLTGTLARPRLDRR